MSGNEPTSSHDGENEKRGPFDNLDRDELIKKCKGLLGIAQKAKKAKDDYANEATVLKEQVTKYETQKQADKECLKAMQEMVDSLTEYKLTSTNRVADCERRETGLSAKIAEYENQLRSFNEMSIEHEALQRQVKRLTEENEEQATDLSQMHERLQHVTKLSEVQNSQLIELEMSVDHWKEIETKYNVLVNECDALQMKFNEAQKETSDTSATQFNEEKEGLEDTLRQVTLDFEQTKNENKALKDSLNQIRSDLEEIGSENKTLKDSINQLTADHKEINDENVALKESLNQTKANLEKTGDENKALKDSINQTISDFEKTKLELERVLHELSTLKEQTTMASSQAESNMDHYLKEKEELKEQIKSQANKLSKYKTKIIEFSTKLKQLRHTKEVLLDTVTEYSNSITQWQNEIVVGSKQLFDKLHELEQKNTSLEQHLKTNESAIQSDLDEKNDNLNAFREIEMKHSDLIKQFDDSAVKISEQNEVIETLKANSIKAEELERLALENKKLNDSLQLLTEENNQLNEQISTLNSDFENSNKNNATFSECLENEKVALQKQAEVLQTEMAELKVEIEAKSNGIKDADEKINLQSKQNDDLLMEMRELNEALKNRGDVISKQNTEISKLQQLAQDNAGRVSELDNELKEKDKTIEQLTNSLAKCGRSEQETNVTDTHSEILSTSTISRVEEAARMRDFEDSFEEKYNKLRGLAIKLKKKVTEQQQTIAKLEANASSADGSNLRIQNLKSLQSENDRLLDNVESLTNANKQLAKELSDLKEKLGAKESEMASRDASTANTKSALDEVVSKCKKENEALIQENNNLKTKQRDQENELIKLNDELKTRKIELESKLEAEKKLKSELNKNKSSAKKNNVLNLEMEAYEKSLKDISQKLESKKLLLAEMESGNKMLENTIDTLKNEMKLLDESLRAEKQHSMDLKQEIDMQQIKLKESEHEKSELKIKIDETTNELNGIKLELADLRTEQSQFTVDNQKLIATLENENERNTRRIFAMEDEIRTLKTTLNETNQELDTVQTEFASYKVRAQSVLRQNQLKDSSNEDELKEELAAVTQAKEALAAKLSTHVEQFKHLQSQCEQQKCDKENLQMRCKELLQLLDESRHQIDLIHEENRKQQQEQQEALKSQRLQIDTLNACYKKQIAELEEKHEAELGVLKSAIKPLLEEQKVVSEKSKTETIPMTEERRIDWIMMERQAGEGSENTGSIHNVPHRKTSTVRNKRDLIPLDELLNSSFDDAEPSITEDHSISPSIELQNTKDKLQVQHRRVKHLSTLLSEAEMDVARLTQLNDVLKEELRRHERSTEREMHMHNLEYIKNIIFKFLTINNADERAHLVPVLNTILKLSPDELNRLQAVARGGDASHSGWSSLLPMW